jgi:hypothetical protein
MQVYSWNLSLQRQVGSDWLVSASYLGNHTIHLWSTQQYNPAVFLGLGACTINGINYATCSTTANQEQRRRLYLQNPAVGQYYGLHSEDNFAMKEEYYVELNDKFYRKFGFRPITTVNKWLRWEKSSEPAQWMRRAGGKADNSFFGINVPFTHPMANGPFWGFGCGTSFPFFFYEDYRGGNQRIDFLEQPIVCYEIGHRGSMAVTPRDPETLAVDDFHVPIKMAIKNHLVMNMFYHPVYIAEYPKAREGIEGLLRFIKDLGASVVHVGNDEVWTWWTERSRSTLENVNTNSDGVTFIATAEYRKGMVVKLKVPDAQNIAGVTCDGKKATFKLEKEFGTRWMYLIVPFGKHDIQVTIA